MPQDAFTVRQDVIEETGHHDVVVLEKYEAPGDPEVEDLFRDFDNWRAKRIFSLLIAHYPGHLWATQSDVAQGIVKIGIPILMGICNWYVINLSQTELTPGAIIVAGGEILERYRLPRSRLELGSFLQARANHSALVNPWQAVPS